MQRCRLYRIHKVHARTDGRNHGTTTDRRRTKWSLCDLWPSKSIRFILSPWLTCLPSLIKKSTTVKSLLCSQAYFHRCPLWPWPLTSKINRVHPLIMVNMSSKFDKEICNGVDSTQGPRTDRRTEPRNHSSVTIGQTDTRTHRQTPDKVIPMCRYALQATQKSKKSTTRKENVIIMKN